METLIYLRAEVLLVYLLRYFPVGKGVPPIEVYRFCKSIKEQILSLGYTFYVENDRDSLYCEVRNHSSRYEIFMDEYRSLCRTEVEMVNAGIPKDVQEILETTAKKWAKEKPKVTSELTSPQTEMLTAYRLFYGENYVPKNDESHRGVQAMVYFLGFFGMDDDNYGFLWHNEAPFCPDLKTDLDRIDVLGDEVEAFYRDQYRAKNDGFYIIPRIFEKVNQLKKTFLIESRLLSDTNYSSKDWARLLSAIAFLKISVIPTASFDSVYNKLGERGSVPKDINLSKEAWRLLQLSGIISIDSFS